MGYLLSSSEIFWWKITGYRPIDGRTDWPTGIPSLRDVWTHLKTIFSEYPWHGVENSKIPWMAQNCSTRWVFVQNFRSLPCVIYAVGGVAWFGLIWRILCTHLHFELIIISAFPFHAQHSPYLPLRGSLQDWCCFPSTPSTPSGLKRQSSSITSHRVVSPLGTHVWDFYWPFWWWTFFGSCGF